MPDSLRVSIVRQRKSGEEFVYVLYPGQTLNLTHGDEWLAEEQVDTTDGGLDIPPFRESVEALIQLDSSMHGAIQRMMERVAASAYRAGKSHKKRTKRAA